MDIDLKTKEGLEVYRHSASHIMAMAVKELYPEVKLGIGPAIANGFYYDFDIPVSLTPSDLEKIEEKMQEIINKKVPFNRKEISKKEAMDLFKGLGEIYKVELLSEIPDDKVSLYESGGFVDLCRGPHVLDSGSIKAFKLTDIAGAYWRGNSDNKMLQRIYGTAFPDRKLLKVHLKNIEEAKKRDHRKLGQELDLFSIQQDSAGPGLIFWHPKGACIRNIIENFWREEHLKRGYDLTYTPHIAKVDLWKTSGHWEFYKEYMYSPMEVDTDQYIVKPMNCPGHILIYNNTKHSYRELPIRWAELGTVYRYEKSGVLHGMLRVRGFTQDDAHIFCTPEQLKNEIIGVLDLVNFMMDTFGFQYQAFLSTRPEKYVGAIENWDKATTALEDALKETKLKYTVDPGEGVFYGPKIDIKMVDAIGREWQGPTIQVDFNLPERFNVNYTGTDGKEHQVVMIHRAVLGSFERFFGVLVEHYGGRFPLWLAPVQIAVLTITKDHDDYADKLKEKLTSHGFRVKINKANDKINAKIRNAELDKIPYMVVIGDKEVENNNISVRKHRAGSQGGIPVDDFINKLIEEVKTKKST